MKIDIRTITPAIASQYLAHNTSNRKVEQDRVIQYSTDMATGAWMNNGESIKFDKNGILIDGQHRLLSIIKSGVTLKDIPVITGLEPEVKATIDTQKSRSANDVLQMSGVKNSANIAAAIKKYMILSSGYRNTRLHGGYYGATNAAIQSEYYSKEETYQNIFSAGAEFYRKNYRVIPISDYIAFYMLFSEKYSTTVVDGFFSAIESKIGVCGLLYDRLMNNNIATRKITTTEKNAITIKAFNFYNSGKVVKLLKWSSEEKFPTVE